MNNDEDNNQTSQPDSPSPDGNASGDNPSNSIQPEDTNTDQSPSIQPEISNTPANQINPDTVTEKSDLGVVDQNNPQPTQQPTVQFAPAPKKSPVKSILLTVFILVILGALAFYFLSDKKHAKTTNIASTSTIAHLTIGIDSNGDLGAQLYPKAEDTDGTILTNSQIFEGLVQYENQDQIVPDIASGWTNPTTSTWLFTIKPGIKFHDGNTLTPADVVYSINNLISLNNEYAQTFTNNIKSAKQVGTNQVEITTSQPDPVLLNQLAFIYIIDQNLPKGDEPSLGGTGPYEVKPGTTPSNQQMKLVAFNNYHNGPVLTKSLTFDSVSSIGPLLQGFKNHIYNIVGQVPNSDANQPGAHEFIEQDNAVDFLGFNTTTGPLSNKLVREAIRYAVDPVAIDNAYGLKAIPISQLIPPSIPGYNPAITPYQQNITKAKQLLAEAGYSKGLTLTLTTNDQEKNIVEAASELKAIGITTNVMYQADFNNFINNYLSGNGQIFFLGYSSDTLDGVDIMQSVIATADYNNPTFTSLVNQASTTIDPTKRIQLLQQASKVIDTDIAVVPLSYNDNIWLMDKPYVVHQDLQSAYISAYFYKVHL